MLDTILSADPEYLAVGLAVTLLAIARLQTSDRIWAPSCRALWSPLRRFLWPVLDEAFAHVPGLYAKTTVRDDEVVVEGLDISLCDLLDDLEAAGYEYQPLASLARFDPSSSRGVAGEVERASLARYHGDRVGGGLTVGFPDWFVRNRQVHIRPYGADGNLTVTAHDEYNAWNPVFALHHLGGIGLDADRGVQLAAADLGIEEYVDDGTDDEGEADVDDVDEGDEDDEGDEEGDG